MTTRRKPAKTGKSKASKRAVKDLDLKSTRNIRGGTDTSSGTTGAGAGKIKFNEFTITKTT